MFSRCRISWKILNEIVHPQVKVECDPSDYRANRKKSTPLFVIESALLPEAGYEDICQEMWYIYTERSYSQRKIKSIPRIYAMKRITQDDSITKFRRTISGSMYTCDR